MKHDQTLNNENHELTVNELDAVAGGISATREGKYAR
jgi:hypothetical protein